MSTREVDDSPSLIAAAPRRTANGKRTATEAGIDDDRDLIGALVQRRSPRKIRAEASTAGIDDAIEAHPTRARGVRASSPRTP